MSDLVGKKAPVFTLEDQNGEEVSLKDFQGKYVVLYFYPRDMTSGCTKEAQGFRDLKDEFEELNAVILGISKDIVKSHKKFEEKEGLNFKILSDVDTEIIQRFGVWVEKSMYGKKYMGTQRDTFLIGPDSKVLRHYQKVKAATHPQEILNDLKEFAD